MLFFWREGGFLYPVSEAFLQEVRENTRNLYWTGKVTTKDGAVYPFIYAGDIYIYPNCIKFYIEEYREMWEDENESLSEWAMT